MAVIVMGHYATLTLLVAHVHRIAFSDVPWDRPSRRLLKHMGYLVEASLFLDVVDEDAAFNQEEEDVAFDTEGEGHTDSFLLNNPYEDEETIHLVESVSVEIYQHMEQMFPGHELLTITPIDARGNAVLILTPSSVTTGVTHAKNL